VIFSSNIIKIPESSVDRAWKKEGKKDPRVSSKKGGSEYFERGKHFKFKNPF
jgi:hypothetical protein